MKYVHICKHNECFVDYFTVNVLHGLSINIPPSPKKPPNNPPPQKKKPYKKPPKRKTRTENNLEALRECRSPWPRQIITLILPTVKMLSLGCERLPTPLKNKKKQKKVLDHYLHHDLGMLPLLRCFFAHLLILQYPDHHQNLISSSLYYSGPVHKISSQSVHNILSNVVHRQTNQRYQKHNLLCQGGNKQTNTPPKKKINK